MGSQDTERAVTVPLIFTTPSKKREPVDRGTLEEVILDALPSPRRVVARYLSSLGNGR